MEAQAKNLRCDPANSLVKIANPQATPPPVSYPQLNTPGVSDQFAHSAKTEMAGIWTKAIMAALSAGILGRVGLGAFRSIVPAGKTPYGPDTGTQTLDISTEEDEKKAAAYPALAKQASERPFPFNHVENTLYSQDGKGLFAGSNWFTTPRETDTALKWLPWVKADTASQGAWGIPATYGAIPAALAALYGGYKLTDYILDKRRKATSEDDLASAKEEYEAALSDKKASADIDADFDLIAENAVSGVEKQSTALQTAGGLYGAYGILAALTAGIPAYTFFKNRSKREMISRALAERQSKRYGQGIRPIYAYSSEGAAEAGEDDNKLSLEV